MSGEQQRKVRNIIRWQRIGCVVVKISETLNVSLKEALDLYTEARLAGGFMMRRPGSICKGTYMF